MIEPNEYDRVGQELQRLLKPHFPDVEVKVGDDLHYKGTNVVVTSALFEGLLAEQRFHHVVRALPEHFYETHLKTHVVWFELTPTETGADLMRMPRSTDVVADQGAIRSRIDGAGFYTGFLRALAERSQPPSAFHFELTRQALAECGLSPPEITRACLFMILHGAYCDAQVQTEILPKFSPQHAPPPKDRIGRLETPPPARSARVGPGRSSRDRGLRPGRPWQT